jgi:hypothetical protein
LLVNKEEIIGATISDEGLNSGGGTALCVVVVPARIGARRGLRQLKPFGSFRLSAQQVRTCPNIVVVAGLLNFDGSGGVTGSFSQYASDRGGRGPKALSGTVSGTYAFDVSGNGMGTISLVAPKIGTFAFVLDSTATLARRIELINTSSHSWTCAMSGYAIQQ